jgi:hypothetical protein
MSIRRLCAALGAAGLALAAAPAAYAIWTAHAAGSAAATAAAPLPLVITAGTSPTQAVFPTGTPTGSVTVSIQNPNPYRVHVGTLALDAAAGSGGFSPNAAGCGLAFTPPAGGGWDVPGNGSADLELVGVLTMSASAPASCARLAVDVHLETAP